MIVQAHIDESEDESLFVMAGHVASADDWAKFSDDWDVVLAAAPSVSHLKTSQAMANPRRGPFRGLTSEQRDAKLVSLYEVIDRYVSFEISSVVHVKPLKRIFSTEEFGPQAANPYYHGLSWLIYGVIIKQIEHGMEEHIDFIFDEGRHESKQILQVWPAVVHDLPDHIKSRIGSTPVFKPDTGPDGLRPLQAADLEAWWVRIRTREKLLNLPRREYPWTPAAIPCVEVILDEEFLQKRYGDMLKKRDELALLGLA